MSTKIGMGFFAIFISVFYLAGFGLLGYGLWSARRSTQAAHWPTTPGTLTNIDLKMDSDSDGDGTTYEVQVEYTYTVAGKAYEGSRLAFGYTGGSDRQEEARIHDKLKGAKSVDVRYDPDDPASSALSFGIHGSIKAVLSFAITWLVCVVGFTWMWWATSRTDTVLLQNLSVR
jgi:hypothetical protein